MEIPKFDVTKYSVLIVESKTGKIFNTTGSYYANNSGEKYVTLFSKYEAALDFAIKEMKERKIDVAIYNKNGGLVKYLIGDN